MSQLDAYLFFDGNCAEAMRFYERTLGGTMQTFMKKGESPVAADVPPEDRDRIMHASLLLDGGRVLLASDAYPGQPYEGMHGFSLSLSYATAAEAERVFGALSDGGRVLLPIGKTFWADAFGMLIDRFGTPWMISAHLDRT